jgi:energy-coupling factor transporter ATP-binding protein EcfA2
MKEVEEEEIVREKVGTILQNRSSQFTNTPLDQEFEMT